ncbi:hypothetical protein BDK51DRAFT_40771, partial [Blyttiomyces helicus]
DSTPKSVDESSAAGTLHPSLSLFAAYDSATPSTPSGDATSGLHSSPATPQRIADDVAEMPAVGDAMEVDQVAGEGRQEGSGENGSDKVVGENVVMMEKMDVDEGTGADLNVAGVGREEGGGEKRDENVSTMEMDVDAASRAETKVEDEEPSAAAGQDAKEVYPTATVLHPALEHVVASPTADVQEEFKEEFEIMSGYAPSLLRPPEPQEPALGKPLVRRAPSTASKPKSATKRTKSRSDHLDDAAPSPAPPATGKRRRESKPRAASKASALKPSPPPRRRSTTADTSGRDDEYATETDETHYSDTTTTTTATTTTAASRPPPSLPPNPAPYPSTDSPFPFNLTFGALFSLSAAFGRSPIPAWYAAQALFYVQSDKGWRLKVHYVGYPKQQDHFMLLEDAEDYSRIRPYEEGEFEDFSNAEETKEPMEAALRGEVLLADRKPYGGNALTAAMREMVERGEVVVKEERRASTKVSLA